MHDDGAQPVENFDYRWNCRRDFHLTDPGLIAKLESAHWAKDLSGDQKGVPDGRDPVQAQSHSRATTLKTGGRFGPRRHDAGISVAHRRFAVSINLNALEGGEISFPEYGPRSFSALPGTAIVFSASILHRVSRVKRGRRLFSMTKTRSGCGRRI
jgi:hypothetical protein